MNESEDVRMIQDLFRKADADKNGVLNRAELGSIMKVLLNGKEPSSQDVDKLFKTIDADGSNSIEEAEFTRVLLSWLKVSRNDNLASSPKSEARGVLSPGRLHRQSSLQPNKDQNRRRAQNEIVNFFQQFDTKPNDPQAVIQRILNSQPSGLDLKNIRRGLKKYTNEEKIAIHSKILGFVQSGRSFLDQIIIKLHSSKAEDIYNSLLNVCELLEITEAFTTNAERLEMSVLFIEVFEALVMTPTHLLGSDMRPMSSIVTRLLLLVDPNTPVQILQLALKCLRDFAWGPNIPSLNVDSCWFPEKHLTKAILEGQSFLLRIIHVLSVNTTINSGNQGLLVSIFDAVAAYTEFRTRSLEEAIQLRVREYVLNIFRQGMSIELMRSVTGLVGVLSGYTHTMEDTSESSVFAKSLIWPPEQLETILAACNKTYQDMIDATSNPIVISSGSSPFDSLIVINNAIIIQQCLCFCDLKNPLFSSLIGHLLFILKHYQTEYKILCDQLKSTPGNESIIVENTQVYQFVVRAIDSAFTELCCSYSEVSLALLQNDDFVTFLNLQLRSYQLVVSGPNSGLGDGLEVVRSAMDVLYAMIETGLLGKVLTIFGESIFLLSNISSIRYWIVKILHRCCMLNAAETSAYLTDIGILDLLFGLLSRYKTYQDPSFDVLALAELGAFYDLDLLNRLLSSLIELASLQSKTANGSTYMTLGHKFTAEHVDTVIFLHASMCFEMSKGNLVSPGEANDINHLSQRMNHLLQLISDGMTSIHSPHARMVGHTVKKHFARWSDDLTHAYDQGIELVEDMTIGGVRRRSFMDTDDTSKDTKTGKVIRGLPFLHIEPSSEYMVILKPVVPAIQNGVEIFVETDEEKRYFISPDVNLKDLVFSASYLYEHMVSLSIKVHSGNDTKYVPIETNEQLSAYINQIIASAANSGGTSKVKEILLFVTSPRSSLHQVVSSDVKKKMLENAALPSKDQVLTELRRLNYDQNIKIDLGMMEKFYQYFEAKKKVEIDLPLFVEAMVSVSVPPNFAQDMFRAFDIDNSGTLSLKEIAVGLGKLMDGDQDDILHIVFRAYDLDHSDTLDFSEIVHMIAVALGIQDDLASMYATAAFQAMNIHPSNGITFIQFREAVYTGKLQVGSLWASGLPTLRSEDKKAKPAFHSGLYKQRNDRRSTQIADYDENVYEEGDDQNQTGGKRYFKNRSNNNYSYDSYNRGDNGNRGGRGRGRGRSNNFRTTTNY